MTSLRGHKRQEFAAAIKRAAFRRCCQKDGKPRCESCGNILRSGNITYEHLDPDGLGGQPTLENCGVWCSRPCSAGKTKNEDAPRMVKADRVLRKTYDLAPRGPKMQGQGFRRRQPQRTASRPIERRT